MPSDKFSEFFSDHSFLTFFLTHLQNVHALSSTLLKFLNYHIYSHSFKKFTHNYSQSLMTNSYSELQVQIPIEHILLDVSHQLQTNMLKHQAHYYSLLNQLLLKWPPASFKIPQNRLPGIYPDFSLSFITHVSY